MREAQADLRSRTVHGLYYLCVWGDYFMYARNITCMLTWEFPKFWGFVAIRKVFSTKFEGVVFFGSTSENLNFH